MPADLSRYPHWQRLVATDPAYRQAWLEGRFPPGLPDDGPAPAAAAKAARPLERPGPSRNTAPPQPKRIQNGPGTELHALFESLGIREMGGCSCLSRIRQMDQWGVAGCREHLDEIVASLREGQHRYGWREKITAAAKMVTTGLAFKVDPLDPFPGIVEEAIRRAEAKEATRPAGPRRHQGRPTIPGATYLTAARLMEDTRGLLAVLPPDLDAIVGVARSGLLPANLLACHLHRPLWATGGGGLVECGRGARMAGYASRAVRSVAVVDDTAWHGLSMRSAVAQARAAFPGAAITTVAVYCHPGAAGKIDVVGAIYGGPHYLQWNLFNSVAAPKLATDLDGILCDERTGGPLQVPRREPVAAIVTGRPRTDRAGTEAWLARWGIRYRTLVMGPWSELPPEAEIGRWKAKVYATLGGVVLFVESSPVQAQVIRERSGRPVLCPALGRILV